MKTLPLNWDTWDLALDSSGNLGIVDSDNNLESEQFYCAQTVANAIRQFRNDAYFFTNEGMPHFEEILGFRPPDSLIMEYIVQMALTVPLVTAARVLEVAFKEETRSWNGIIEIRTQNGSQLNVSF